MKSLLSGEGFFLFKSYSYVCEVKSILMKIKILVLFLITAIVVSCNNTSEDCKKPFNPNGDSELAVLMRDMTMHLEQERGRLNDGIAPSAFPEEFKKIKTAKASDPEQITVDHHGLADVYLNALTAYHAATPENYTFAYNNLVKSCINCHQHECPGPIKRIQKLIITE